MVLTRNEKRLLSYLWRNYTEQSSINELAKRINITPKGAYKILQKFEKEDIVAKKRIANAMIYQLNFNNSKTEDIVKYTLKSEPAPNAYVKVIKKDLQIIKEVTKAVILFGSVLTKGLNAKDIDLFVIIDKKKFQDLKTKIQEFESISPKKVHLLVQTEKDIKKNLRKRDPVVQEVLRKGCFLWGYNVLYKLIKNDAS